MKPAQATAPQLVIPLDNCTEAEAQALANELAAAGISWFKVGLELYTQAGPQFVRSLKKSGHKVFLDLKLHDIPNTVAKAVGAAVSTGADMLTLHCSGGPEMLAAAREAASGSSLALVGVTVLTSFGDAALDSVADAWGHVGAVSRREDIVQKLAALAAASGIHGIVCSAPDLEGAKLRTLSWFTARPLFVTPGIRNSGDARNDQKSVATITEAVKLGSSHLVMGRPITAPHTGTRAEAAARALREIKEAHVVPAHP